MKNDKGYSIRVWLNEFTVKHNGHHRAITPDTYRIMNGKFETHAEEMAARKEVDDEFGALLDSVDSDNPVKALEDLYWKVDNVCVADLEVGRVVYRGDAIDGEEFLEVGTCFHNISYAKYLKMGKPKTLDLIRTCKDVIVGDLEWKL